MTIIIIMRSDATQENINGVIDVIEGMELTAKVINGNKRIVICVIGDSTPLNTIAVDGLPGVEWSMGVSKKYKLVGRDFHPQKSVIRVGDIEIGGGNPIVIAGPCAVESKEQLMVMTDIVKKSGAQFLRGGVYKFRTSPYSFQGMQENGLAYLAEARERTGLKIVTEITAVNSL